MTFQWIRGTSRKATTLGQYVGLHHARATLLQNCVLIGYDDVWRNDPAARVRTATRCWRHQPSPASAGAAGQPRWIRRHADVMAREQRCLVYSIDAILGLTGNGQRSASTTVGRRSCRDESNDECQLQTNDAAAAAASRNGRPGIGRSLHFSRATYDRRNRRHHYHHVYRHQSSQLVSCIYHKLCDVALRKTYKVGSLRNFRCCDRVYHMYIVSTKVSQMFFLLQLQKFSQVLARSYSSECWTVCIKIHFTWHV